MMQTLLTAAALLVAIVRPLRGADEAKRPDWQLSDNLIPNGGFEIGSKYPESWQPVDGLSTFWTAQGRGGGKCVMIDTDVLLDQWRRRQEEIAARPNSPPPQKSPTRPPKYDTVAANDGVHYKCLAKIPYREGAVYLLSVDCRAEVDKKETAAPFVWCRGYIIHRGRERRIGEGHLYLHETGPDWKTHYMLIHPGEWKSTLNARPIKPDYFKVILYAYWPPGRYWFDNVSLVEVDEARLPHEIKQKAAQPQRPPQPPAKSKE